MLYTAQELDRSTGELLTKSLGDWITLSELGQRYGVGPRRVRTILRELDFVYAPAANPKASHRISPWAIEAGFGRHHKRSARVRHAFDVISPTGQEWIAARWEAASKAVNQRLGAAAVQKARSALAAFRVSRTMCVMTAQQEVCWLADHFPDMSQDQMAAAIDVTRQLVSRHLNIRSAQIAKWRDWRDRPFAANEPRAAPEADIGCRGI